MKKQIIPSTNQFGNGVTQWADPSEGGTASGGSGFSWDNLLSNLGGILGGIGSIVGNANSYSRTTDNTNRNIDEATERVVYRNDTTVTVVILGGIAVIITLILVLGKK